MYPGGHVCNWDNILPGGGPIRPGIPDIVSNGPEKVRILALGSF